MIKLLCKWFKLIKREYIVFNLSSMGYKMAMSKKVLKHKYNNKEISEWEFYKRLWNLRGRLSMLEDIIKLLR